MVLQLLMGWVPLGDALDLTWFAFVPQSPKWPWLFAVGLRMEEQVRAWQGHWLRRVTRWIRWDSPDFTSSCTTKGCWTCPNLNKSNCVNQRKHAENGWKWQQSYRECNNQLGPHARIPLNTCICDYLWIQSHFTHCVYIKWLLFPMFFCAFAKCNQKVNGCSPARCLP